VVTKSLLAEGLGAFAAEVLETPKARRVVKQATKAYLAGDTNQNRRSIVGKYERFFAAWENDVIRYLQEVSTSAPGVTTPGNSDNLVRRVRQADTYKKTETRVKHIITELEAMQNMGLVYNSSLPQASTKPAHAEASLDASKLLKDLEASLRRFIERELLFSDLSISGGLPWETFPDFSIMGLLMSCWCRA
jgi:hypothetical protein